MNSANDALRERRKKRLRRPFVVTVTAIGAASVPVAVAVGCGDNKPPYAATGGSSVGPPVDDGRCTTEGAARACRIDLGTSNGFHNCFAGTQTCTGGVWSTCGGQGVVTSSAPGALVPAGLHASGSGLSPQAILDGSADASICLLDPCNPYCLGWDNDAAVSLDAAGASIVGVNGFGADISGNDMGNFLDDPCHHSNPPGPTCDSHTNGSLYACQMDTYCALQSLSGNGCCKQFPALGTYPTVGTNPYLGTEPGIDLTLGPLCGANGTNYPNAPICNRGTTPLLPPGFLTIDVVGPGGQLPTASCPPANPTPSCSMPIPLSGIAPGECILMDLAASCSGGVPPGKKYLYLNADYSIPETNVTPQVSTGQPAQPGCADNWSIHPPGSNPPPCYTSGVNTSTFEQTYQSDCPPGTHAQWNQLTWNSTCPTSGGTTSQIIFKAATAPLVGGVVGTFTPFVGVGEAENSTPYRSDPEICDLSGPAVVATCTNADSSGVQLTGGNPTDPPCCPKNFLAAFQKGTTATPFAGVGTFDGLQMANHEVLLLQITLTSTADGIKAPTLTDWSVSYSCLPSE